MAKLLTLLNILIIPKGHFTEINPFLSSQEIQCKCTRDTCHYSLLNPVAAEAFYEVRLVMGIALGLNSFFRCQAHNKEVGGVDESSHTTGNALDIDTSLLSTFQKQKLVKLCKEQFDYVKVYKNFVHCQINPEQGGICEQTA